MIAIAVDKEYYSAIIDYCPECKNKIKVEMPNPKKGNVLFGYCKECKTAWKIEINIKELK